MSNEPVFTESTEEDARPGRNRRVYNFVIDVSAFTAGELEIDHDVDVGIVALTGDEEVEAISNASASQGTVFIEMAKASLRFWDGAPVKRGEFEEKLLWQRMGPVARSLVIMNHNEISNPSKEIVEKAKQFRISSARC